MVEQAHFGTTRYTALSLRVIHDLGKPKPELQLWPCFVFCMRHLWSKEAHKSSVTQRNFTLSRRLTARPDNSEAPLAQIACLLLCHKDPEAIIGHARRLTGSGDYLSIHLERRAPRAHLAELRAARCGRFFASTWIPDEILFQTLVPPLVPRAEIRNRVPTFVLFTDCGMPVTFHDDHFDLLVEQAALFSR